MELVSTVLAQFAVAEGGDPFLALLVHLRRRYPEVYGSAVGTSRAPECRKIQIGEGEVLSGGNSSIHINIKLGAYSGRLANLNLAGINNPSPNLTTVYVDTPLVGPTPEPLEYTPSSGHLGQPSGYPPTITGAYIGASRRSLPPPTPPYSTHPRMHPPTGRAQPRRVMKPATGHAKTFETLATRG